MTRGSKGRIGRAPVNRTMSRTTDLRRQVETQDERWTILVVTNGRRTECDYLAGFKIAFRSVINHFEVKFKNEAPSSLVSTAAVMLADSEHDEVWVVCDVDDFDVTVAMVEARRFNVNLALSVPSFEIWLILHLRDGCPGFNDAKQAVRYLQGLLPQWTKENLEFDDFAAAVDQAMERAKRLGEPPRANPSTAVWRLIESLRAEHANQT